MWAKASFTDRASGIEDRVDSSQHHVVRVDDGGEYPVMDRDADVVLAA
jgi:hypothetical protein